MKLTKKEATRRAQDGEDIIVIVLGGNSYAWYDDEDEAVEAAEAAGGDVYDLFDWATGLRV